MSRWKLVSSLRVKNTWRPSVGGGTSMSGDPRGRPCAARLQQPVRRQLEGFFRKSSPIWCRERKDCPRRCGASSARCVADAIVVPAVVKQDLSDRRCVVSMPGGMKSSSCRLLGSGLPEQCWKCARHPEVACCLKAAAASDGISMPVLIRQQVQASPRRVEAPHQLPQVDQLDLSERARKEARRVPVAM